VSLAENGQRRFRVVDLMILAFIFKVSPIRLIQTGTDTTLRFGIVTVKEADLLRGWLIGFPGGPLDKDTLQTTWPELRDPDYLAPLTDALERAYDQDPVDEET